MTCPFNEISEELKDEKLTSIFNQINFLNFQNIFIFLLLILLDDFNKVVCL